MNKILIISGFVFAFGLLGCEDFLETKQLTSQTVGNYYSSPEEAELALVGCYDQMQRLWSGGIAFPVASDVMADLSFGGTGAADGDGYAMIDEHDKSRSPGDLNLYETNWADYYKGIFRCNTLILNIDQAYWDGNDALRNQIEAEARFLRAYMYFDLTRFFGQVPLITVPTKESVPQNDIEEIYTLIAEDLLFAVEHARSASYSGIAASDFGHADKWAAQALLARVYLFYTGYYNQSDLVGLVTQAEALAGLEDIISNGGFSLVPSYYDLWPAASTYAAAQRGDSISANTYAGESNPEVIYAIKYTYTSTWDGNVDGNHWLVMNGLRNQSWAAAGYGNGWGANTVIPEVYENWDPTDDRRDASIMAIEEEGIDFSQIADVKEYTGYFTKKYTPTCDAQGRSIAQDVLGGASFMISQFQDYFSIRYSDVLLMAAELGSANALDYVNEVRNRAGLGDVATVTKDIIYEERMYEFAFEGHRYWDLLRYDHTLAYAAEKLTWSGTVKSGNADVPKTIDGQKILTTKGLSQIPTNQITLTNNVLVQNEGW